MNDKIDLKNETPTIGNTLLGAVPLVSEVYLMDNIELMKHYPDKYFDLAVVDPPYGIGFNGHKQNIKTKNWSKEKGIKEWDNEIPNVEYFTELFRVSKEQIVWGGNYMTNFLEPKRCWLIWYKVPYKFKLSQAELAWTSFDSRVRVFERMTNMDRGFMGNQIHPTQKPVALYDWIFANYAEEGMKILDTHLGSGSSRISANKAKLHFVGCEIDEDYFNKQNKRYEEFVSQARLW